MKSTPQIPDGVSRELDEAHRLIERQVAQDNDRWWGMVTVCVIIGFVVMGVIGLCSTGMSANLMGYAIGAVVIAGVAYLFLAD